MVTQFLLLDCVIMNLDCGVVHAAVYVSTRHVHVHVHVHMHVHVHVCSYVGLTSPPLGVSLEMQF